MTIKRRSTSTCLIILMMFIFIPASSAQDSKPISSKSWSNTVLWNGFSKTNSAAFTVKIGEKLPEYQFKIIGKLKADIFLPHHLEIAHASNGSLIQRLMAKNRFDNHGNGWDAEFDLKLADIVQFIDMNFDGYRDLRLLYNTGATGNNWYASYICDPSSGKFKYHSELSKLSGVKVDSRNKQIVTYDRNGFCSECNQYYKVIANKLALIKIEWTEIDRRRDEEMGGFGCFKYTGEPRSKNLRFDASRLTDDYKYLSSIRKKIINIKEEPLYGSLDQRPRGVFGNPMD